MEWTFPTIQPSCGRSTPIVAIMNNGPERGVPGDGQTAQVDPVDPGRLSAPQKTRRQRDENTDAATRSPTKRPRAESLSAFESTADGARFTVQLGDPGPRRHSRRGRPKPHTGRR